LELDLWAEWGFIRAQTDQTYSYIIEGGQDGVRRLIRLTTYSHTIEEFEAGQAEWGRLTSSYTIEVFEATRLMRLTQLTPNF
jgi:hypothetical protein